MSGKSIIGDIRGNTGEHKGAIAAMPVRSGNTGRSMKRNEGFEEILLKNILVYPGVSPGDPG